VKLAAAFAIALLLQLGLTAGHLWWGLAACQPLLLVVVATARRFDPVGVAWCGLGAGLASDVLAERIIGPGGIAGAVAGVAVAVVVRRFEMEGPLYWIVGSLLAAACSEASWLLLTLTLGVRPDHMLLDALATVAMTGAAGLVVASGERALRAWRSPERRRRRVLRQL
jgi:rod shape-determining protein MreD